MVLDSRYTAILVYKDTTEMMNYMTVLATVTTSLHRFASSTLHKAYQVGLNNARWSLNASLISQLFSALVVSRHSHLAGR